VIDNYVASYKHIFEQQERFGGNWTMTTAPRSLVETAADIMTAQIRQTSLSLNKTVEGLQTVFRALQVIQHAELELPRGEVMHRDPQYSIQDKQVVCLECGSIFELLSHRHLAKHGLTHREYRHKHRLRLTQALSARALSARRRKVARKRGLGEPLAVWRANRQR
jgi:predicted transcriptional regulator